MESNRSQVNRGSVYFAAHPADILLYQNPDLFRDLYVWKCTTAVLFTSGDRGVKGNYSRGIENGLANAIAFMASENDISPRSWAEADVQFEGEMALLKSLKNWPQVQLLFLRLPDGKPDGTPYREQGLSLKQLYDHRIHTISATDGRAYYGIDDLKDVIATILKKREPNDIRILQHKEPMKIKLNDEDDHADHLVSAKLVAEVIEREELKTNIITYAESSPQSFSTY